MIRHAYVGYDLSKAHVDLYDAVTGRHERIASTSAAIAARLKAYEGGGLAQ